MNDILYKATITIDGIEEVCVFGETREGAKISLMHYIPQYFEDGFKKTFNIKIEKEDK